MCVSERATNANAQLYEATEVAAQLKKASPASQLRLPLSLSLPCYRGRGSGYLLDDP